MPLFLASVMQRYSSNWLCLFPNHLELQQARCDVLKVPFYLFGVLRGFGLWILFREAASV
jgi:hypothetical protein